ncbi:MAG: YbhN family protein [Parvicellaceae bacterium]|tara:strand:+ start:651 stop:1607 length:957 start_codon:yes stop_codon:yes gene_type:complete
MKTKLIKFFKISLPIAIGLYLTWYFISNSTDVEKEYFVQSLSEANYGWIFCALTIAFLSHLSRAYRWKYLLETLDIKPKLSLMYHSVMIGYIINLTIPRSGELARAGYFSRYQKTKSDQVFGTIVVERVVDLIMFASVFLIAFFLQSDQDKFQELRQMGDSSSNPLVLPIFLLIISVVSIIVISIKKIRDKAWNFLKGIYQGATTILKLKNKLAYILHTLFIWTAYVAMLWITAMALPDLQDININAIFACFIAGTIAIGATPGGIGLYPIMVASALTQLYGYDGQVAKSFGMLMWSSQTIFMVLLGVISLIAIKKEN